jgi:hypothetical protein
VLTKDIPGVPEDEIMVGAVGNADQRDRSGCERVAAVAALIRRRLSLDWKPRAKESSQELLTVSGFEGKFWLLTG